MEAPTDRRAHRLAMATAVAFAVSLVFPIGAGLSRSPADLSPIWGILDVIFAFVLAALAITTAAWVAVVLCVTSMACRMEGVERPGPCRAGSDNPNRRLNAR